MLELEKALHARWAEDPTLAQLVSPQNVWTGWRTPPQLPGARIQCTGEEHTWLTSNSEWAERLRIKMTLWSESFSHLRQVLDGVKRVYHRASFDLGHGARVIRVIHRRTIFDEEEHHVWRGEIEFDALALRPAPAQ